MSLLDTLQNIAGTNKNIEYVNKNNNRNITINNINGNNIFWNSWTNMHENKINSYKINYNLNIKLNNKYHKYSEHTPQNKILKHIKN